MILTDLAGYLVSNGLGALGTSIFLGRLPATPDVAATLRQTGGLPPRETFDDLVAIERPRIQVVVRGTGYAAARIWCEQVYQCFDALSHVAMGGVLYLQCEPDGPPAFLERDEQGRPIFVFTMEVWKTFAPIGD